MPPDGMPKKFRPAGPLPAGGPATLTVAEVAAELRVSVVTVLGFIASGELKAVNVARSRRAKRPTWRISREALNAFLASRAVAPPPPKAPRRRRVPADVIQFYT